jgi:hypothetical protein
MGLQPLGKCFLSTHWKQIDHRTTLQIDQNGSHLASTPKRPVIHAENTWCALWRLDRLTDELEQRIWADLNAKAS